MSARQYVEHAYFTYVASSRFDKLYANRWLPRDEVDEVFRNALEIALSPYGYIVSNRYDEIIQRLITEMDQNAFQKEGDEFTGEFCLFTIEEKDAVVRKLLDGNPVGARLSMLGDDASLRAYANVAGEEGWGGEVTDNPDGEIAVPIDDDERAAPASDRVVTFSDNQVQSFDDQTTKLIEEVSSKNQIDDAPGLRELVLGQLKAGRELIRAGSFKLFVMQITLLETLQFLAKRYEKEAVGAFAAALVTALVNALGLSN